MKNISEKELKLLFNKAYGSNGPTREIWEEYYQNDVTFIDPTQQKYGLDAYILAQEKLLKRCSDISLESHSIAINEKVAFIEWTLGLKILNKEFIYPGTTRIKFGEEGKIQEHRDYFDFCGPTFEPIPILGNFIQWLYKRFVS